MNKTSCFVLLTLALAGCEAPSMRATEAPATTQTAPQTAQARAPSDNGVWGNAVAWTDWETALQTAKAENKPVCVVVYADWCPRCKELAPEFAKPALANAATKLVMVRQDQDQHPAWLKERLGAYGEYIPRVLFLDPNGQVREDLQSGHPRYPYFYGPLVTDRLIENMHAAVRR